MTMVKDNSLYLVTGENRSNGRSTLEVVKAALEGGVDIVQMREKDLAREELLSLGAELSDLCRQYGVIFIVNDDPYMARELDADGVHLGQEDIKKYSIEKTREILGDDKIIGLSTHSFQEFTEANNMDVDYLGFGPVFPTKTKDYYIGTDDICRVAKQSKKPVFFIGGIDISNLGEILLKCARNVAVIGAITEAEDITGRVKEFKHIMGRSK